MTERRYALIVAASQYDEPSLPQLHAPQHDARALADVLADAAIGGFEVVGPLVNEKAHVVMRAIDRFFSKRTRDDVLLFYFSGHGLRDDDGQLFFATPDTERGIPTSTSIPAQFLRSRMSASGSRRQLVLLDCCYSGSFPDGAKSDASPSAGAKAELQGEGRVVLMASDALQRAFETPALAGAAAESIFSKYLIEGLRTGAADINGDGTITADELYEYVHRRVVEARPGQEPQKALHVAGTLVVARNRTPTPRPEQLPEAIVDATKNPLPFVREGVVKELEAYLRGGHAGLALAARELLEKLRDDDSKRVSSAAVQVLDGAKAATRSIVAPDVSKSEPADARREAPRVERREEAPKVERREEAPKVERREGERRADAPRIERRDPPRATPAVDGDQPVTAPTEKRDRPVTVSPPEPPKPPPHVVEESKRVRDAHPPRVADPPIDAKPPAKPVAPPTPPPRTEKKPESDEPLQPTPPMDEGGESRGGRFLRWLDGGVTPSVVGGLVVATFVVSAFVSFAWSVRPPEPALSIEHEPQSGTTTAGVVPAIDAGAVDETPSDAAAVPERVRIAYILVAYAGAQRASASTVRSSDDARTRATEILTRVRNGADFAAEARDYSDDPSTAGRDGEMGWITRESVIPEIRDVAFAMPVGGLSDVVSTPLGFIIVRRLE